METKGDIVATVSNVPPALKRKATAKSVALATTSSTRNLRPEGNSGREWLHEYRAHQQPQPRCGVGDARILSNPRPTPH